MERRAFLRASALSVGGLGAFAAGAPTASAANPLRVQVLMFDGVEEQDWAAPVEVLGMAAGMSGGAVTTALVGTGGPGTVTGNFGARVEVPTGWSPDRADVLVVPGGGRYTEQAGPGVRRLMADRAFLRRLADADVLHAGICTGVMVLAAAGLTRGRNATTHTVAKPDLAALGTTVVDARVVDDGDLVTGGGVTSGLDVALWLVERFLGARLAQRVETIIEYERRGTVWRV
ncbi:DJ-1/PfpI family protein [Umezawaea tangerina]|uniref:DJ-1/PfpI family protein n=1 Tax=Umezawaea tangerina TaxID=84725 RepID=A0A2T0TL94_9PSEU|nr:DJ-1/PfpI family protein [Umezawaea tangerina]PRY46492.1 DJ-1/PfpI family protein [Umezawaea tangerina]